MWGTQGGHKDTWKCPKRGDRGLVSEATGNKSIVKPAHRSLDEMKLGKETKTVEKIGSRRWKVTVLQDDPAG